MAIRFKSGEQEVLHLQGISEVADDESISSDNAALATLGYRQEFKRSFTAFEVFAIGFSVIGLFPSMSSVLTFAIPYGGPVALVWGWGICSFFLMFIALALAELGSAAPTSGGLYYWTWSYASPRWRNLLSWIVGYSNSIGLIGGVASVDWGCAVQILAAVSIGRDEQFTPTTPMIYGVFAAIVLSHAFIASLATPVIARLQGVYVLLNLLLCAIIIIALPIATPKEFRNSASFAFGGFTNHAVVGWSNGFAFILSFLAPLWTIGGFDAPVHISEEATNAKVAVPWGIISGVGIAGIVGFVINIVLAFCMGTDMSSIVGNPIEQPMATILFNSLGKNGTLGVWSIVVFVQYLMGSATVFAFARDGALPFSRSLYRVSPLTQTPITAVLACATVALLLALLAFAGDAADSALFSLSIVSQYTAYCVPILSRFLGRGERRFVPGPFSLGRASGTADARARVQGAPVAAVAVAWMAFSITILAFPALPGNPGAGG
ncbi:APC amino acid permease [Epithele typhae]|uniref:APC amino acid permease n=1 Tax=Epithele typhae TaxID=378194 RepID=UPI002007F8A6|nr:APC amino acid permease [Epithele typhae]KAH9918711.1 APC amino acid permease [Epithele typhae]